MVQGAPPRITAFSAFYYSVSAFSTANAKDLAFKGHHRYAGVAEGIIG
jgi:hypothetical protein